MAYIFHHITLSILRAFPLLISHLELDSLGLRVSTFSTGTIAHFNKKSSLARDRHGRFLSPAASAKRAIVRESRARSLSQSAPANMPPNTTTPLVREPETSLRQASRAQLLGNFRDMADNQELANNSESGSWRTQTSIPSQPTPQESHNMQPILDFMANQMRHMEQRLTADLTAALKSQVTRPAPPVTAPEPPVPAPAPVPAPIPTFTSHHPAPTKSLHELFPRVKASLLLDIVRHDFDPTDLFKLGSCFRDKNQKSHLDGERGSILAKPCAKDYPSLTALLFPLNIYFAILVSFAASSGNAEDTRIVAHSTFLYAKDLLYLHQIYEWNAVLQYHMDFHLDRIQEMRRGDYTGWACLDGQLISRHLVWRVRPNAANKPARSSRPNSRSPPSASTHTRFAPNARQRSAHTNAKGAKKRTVHFKKKKAA